MLNRIFVSLLIGGAALASAINVSAQSEAEGLRIASEVRSSRHWVRRFPE